MIIRDKNNNLIVDAPVTQKTTRVFRLMESNYVFLSFNYPLFLNIKKGSYIEHEGQKFYCIRNQQPVELKTENGYLYELYFDAVEYWLKTRRFYYSGQGYKEFSFSYTASIDLFAQIIITNANDRFDSTWQFSIGEEVVSRQESITFKARTIFEACTEIANVFETEWWLTSAGETHTIHFGSLMVGNAIEVRKGEIVKDFPVRKGDDSEYGTRFYIYGSTENLPSNYGIAWMHAIDSLAENRLRMPGSQDYIDAWENLADEDVVEQIVRFDAIKPLHNYEVTAVTTDTINIMEFPGESDIYYWIEVADLLVSFYQGIPPDLLITFESGALNGYSFKPSYVSQWDNNKMKLVPIKDEETGIVLPNVAMAPAVGDKFSISGVDVPQVRVELAEAQLLAAGQDYVDNIILETNLFECPSNPIYCKKNLIDFQPGQRVQLINQRFGLDGLSTRVQGFEKLLYDKYQAVYLFGITRPFSRRKIYEDNVDALSGEVIKTDFAARKYTTTQLAKVSNLRSDVDLKQYYTDASLAVKANALEVYTIEEVDFSLATKANATDVYTKTDANTLLAAKAETTTVNSALATKANATDVYTKTQVDYSLGLKADSAVVDTNYALKAGLSTQDFATKNLSVTGNLSITGTIDHYNQTELNVGDTYINLGSAQEVNADGGMRIYGATNTLLSTLKYAVADSRWKLDKGLDITGTLSATGYNKTNWDAAYGWGDWEIGVNKAFVDNLNINADTLDNLHASQFTRRINLAGQLQITSYKKSVIAICELTNTNHAYNSWSSGKIIFKRDNGLYATTVVEYSAGKHYNSEQFDINYKIYGTGINSIVPCTFTYNGVKYAGFHVYISNSEANIVEFEGLGNFELFGKDYYDTNTSTSLIDEINNSIDITTAGYILNSVYKLSGFNAYHSGNSNLSTVDWSAKVLNVADSININSLVAYVNTQYNNSGKTSTFGNNNNGGVLALRNNVDDDYKVLFRSYGASYLMEGYFGIGIINPNVALDVVGSIRATTNVYTDFIYQNSVAGLDVYAANGFRVQNSLGIDAFEVASGNALIHTGLYNYGVFADGFAGEGFAIKKESSLWNATFDNLTVRKGMQIYELNVNKIRSGNGSYWFSDGAKILQVNDISSAFWEFVFDEATGNPFRPGDIIRCQVFTGTGIKYYELRASSIDSAPNTTSTSQYFIKSSYDNTGYTDLPAAGDEIVRDGNVYDANRRGAIYITSNDSNSPYMSVVGNKTAVSGAHTNYVRVGKLDGITSPNFGTLSGMGFWAAGNAYLEGTIYSTAGKIGGNTIDSYGIRSASQRVHFNNGNNRLAVTKAASTTASSGARVMMYYNDDTNWGLYGSSNGSTAEFQFGSTNQIAAFTINTSKLYAGSIIGSGAGIALDSTNKSFMAYHDSSNYITMYYSSISSWGLKGVNAGSTLFELGQTNKIAPFTIHSDSLFTGTKQTANAYTANATSMTLGSNYLRMNKFRIDTDGNVYAKDATFTNVFVEGRIATAFQTIEIGNTIFGGTSFSLYPTSNNIRVKVMNLNSTCRVQNLTITKGAGTWVDGQVFRVFFSSSTTGCWSGELIGSGWTIKPKYGSVAKYATQGVSTADQPAAFTAVYNEADNSLLVF